eukprot:gene9649-9809_t
MALQMWASILGLLLVLLCTSSSSATRFRRHPLAAASSSSQSQQIRDVTQPSHPVTATILQLQPKITAVWVPTISPSAKSLQVPVPAYVLTGSIQVARSSLGGGTGEEFQEVPIELPTIKLQQSSEVQSISSDKIRCSSLRVTQTSSITCTFAAPIFGWEAPPVGLAQAMVQLPAGAIIKAPSVSYDFNTVITTPSRARFSSADAATNFLLANMQEQPATATVTNYFEPGAGNVIPSGVEGAQPSANIQLSDTKTFTYSALFADIPRDKCGENLQVN